MTAQEGSGRFHHVFVTLKGADKKQALFVDLSPSELKKRFVRPYKRGKPVLLIDHTVVQTRDITWTSIRTTVEAAEPTLERLQEDSRRHTDELNNRGGPVMFMGHLFWSNEDLIGEGADVTGSYIYGPPGEASVYSRLGSWLADNLGKAVIGLLFAIALTVVLTWLGLKK
ncbi:MULTISPECIES: hypothetical protein [Xanthomonas]|uniref:hypothetical protein n=1 Tax=Xanthomonas TaxID=338 RepID=UPI00054382F9|nr:MULTISPECIES: hypothetical protein [Xanthomonas]ATS68155.1 hypothetical protein XcfCFBP6165P_12225 [Xanthomonas citri pv. phaseoli var. fuscans]ATS77249.1 hypothetical protein XcfCFBP6975P_17215 [Xanthomonas citri pv. phaseoli var. fuscans]KHF71851.1 hypothetical protein NY63_19085 [Xanthomonas citri pv. fuscans]PPU32173.1 hypothetical protein XspCFBP7912_13480 [Xanthomonas sp. CFBP 7912]QTK98467.1 hypothetical protein J4T80_16120 [Xanthomonas citri pv. fuscans]